MTLQPMIDLLALDRSTPYCPMLVAWRN